MRVKPAVIIYDSDDVARGGIDPHDVYEANIVIEIDRDKQTFSVLKYRQRKELVKNKPLEQIGEVIKW